METTKKIEFSIANDATLKPAGATAFFPSGSRAAWRVESYVRKVAFCRKPMPRGYLFAKKVAMAALQKVGFSESRDNGMNMFVAAS